MRYLKVSNVSPDRVARLVHIVDSDYCHMYSIGYSNLSLACRVVCTPSMFKVTLVTSVRVTKRSC